jgi:hydrogenase/urease accessory protein HupE
MLLGSTLNGWSHDPGLSTATITVYNQDINVVLGFARQDAALFLPTNADSAGLDTAKVGFPALSSKLALAAAKDFHLLLGEERVAPTQKSAQVRDNRNVEISLQFRRSSAAPLRLRATYLGKFPLGHREFLSVRTIDGAILGEAMLGAKKDEFQCSLPGGDIRSSPNNHSFLEFLKLGVEHILTGYDHLLFLFGLMIVCRNLRSLLTVITCFTIAHSITLALATLDVVRLPGRIVEPLIAASIAYIGLENLIRGDAQRWRGLVAFSFGLVHGLGFADALREFGINPGGFGIVVPLVGFNLGVEVGQLCVAAVALPVLWKLRCKPSFARFWVPACSAAIVFAGGWWMIERIAQS